MEDVGGIIHIAMTVRDLKSSVAFYETNFGFKKVADLCFTAYIDGFFGESEDARKLYGVEDGTICPVALLQLPEGGPMLELFQFTPQREKEFIPWDRAGITHFAFETKKFTRLYERLKNNKVEFCMRPGKRVADGLNWIFLRDVDGNMIEILGTDSAD